LLFKTYQSVTFEKLGVMNPKNALTKQGGIGENAV
jgi:hypothetical protein